MSVIFSGIQPTNNLHLGNYFGAIKNWVDLQKDNQCFFCVVDLHALTVYQKPEALRSSIFNVAKAYLALGVNPEKSVIFIQSAVNCHTELAWILSTIAKMGEMERMTQFKDKSKQHAENINVGLFSYPILMAADILLYDTNFVPVGEDQKQHVELARDLAVRFNGLYGDTFVVPVSLIKKDGGRVMGLDDPSKKMSKSASSVNNYISLLDEPTVVAKKITKAVTDSGDEIKGGANKPALTNLLNIYSLLTGRAVHVIETEYQGQGYGAFKKGLTEIVVGFLQDFQHKFKTISDGEVKSILMRGAQQAQALARAKMSSVKNKIGLFNH